MITLLDLSFWLYFVIFLIAIFFAFFIPGDLLLRRFSLSSFKRFVIGSVVGMVMWGWQGFIFGYFGMRWLSYIYLIILFITWFVLNFKNLKLDFYKKFKPCSPDLVLIVIFIFGVMIQLSAVWFNGILFTEGLYFCCGNLYDNILHIALTHQLVQRFPPYEPGMYGVFVQNYHYWGNLIIADLIRVFKLPLVATQFQYSTLFISTFLGLSAVVFSQLLNLSRRFITWLLFFLYFGGDLVFLLVSFMRKELNFNMSSLEDGAKFLVNPPRSFSIIVFFVGISLLIIWLKKRNLYAGILTAFILGSLIGFKVYTGIFVLSGLSMLMMYFLFKRNFYEIIIILIVFILSVIIYLPVNANAGGLYFTGMALFENFIVQPWMMLDRLELARRIYLEHKSWFRVLEYELIYAFTFIITIFGTKLIGIVQTRKALNYIPIELNILLLGGILVSAVTGFFFQQSTGGANTFNFLVLIFIVGSIYAAIACVHWLSKIKGKIRILIIMLIVILTVPRVIHEGLSNISRIQQKEGFFIANSELNALKYLREKTEKKSLIIVDHRALKTDYESPYISFMTDRPMYLSGVGNELTAHGIYFSPRQIDAETIFTSRNAVKVAKTLLRNNINYIYLSYPYSLNAKDSLFFTQKVYESGKITILKVISEKLKFYVKNN